MSAAIATFEEHLAREILRSERVRMAVLAGIFAALMVLFPFVVFVFWEHYLRNFGSLWTVANAMAVAGALVAYELLLRQHLGTLRAAGAMPSRALWFWSALLETSVPSLLILVIGQQTDPLVVAQGPAAFLYGVFIVLSTLRLDFSLSVFTAVVAAVEFVALSLHFAQGSEAAMHLEALGAPGFILLKGVMLLLAGIAAGFVAVQLRRRMVGAFHALEERQRIVNAFGQQVSPEVVDELLRQGPEIASRRSFVCVMFADARGFTSLVENKSPEEIVAIQNALFGAAIEVVNRHHGTINQFLGDGFMASFGAPIATGEDCANAVAAARELLVRVRELGESGRIPPLELGIGLHAGEAVSGNVGSAARKQYSITGNVVILASRIEQLCKDYGARLLVSGEVLRGAGAQGAGAVPLGPVHVKGREGAIEIYRLA